MNTSTKNFYIFRCPINYNRWYEIKSGKDVFKAACDVAGYKFNVSSNNIKNLFKLLKKLNISTCMLISQLKFKWDSSWGCFKSQKVVRSNILGYYTIEYEKEDKIIVMFSLAEDQEGNKDIKLKEFEKGKIKVAKAWCQKDFSKKGISNYENKR